jgi:PhnB protein
MKEQTKSNETRPTKQADYTWGTPCIIVDNADKAIKTYTEVFGFTVDNTMQDKAGSTNWAKLTYKDFGLHLSDGSCSSDDKKLKSPKASGIPSPVSLYLYNDNVEAVVAKAKAHGLKIIQEPEVMFWGDKMCIIVDESGYIWNFAKNVADFDPSKMPS